VTAVGQSVAVITGVTGYGTGAALYTLLAQEGWAVVGNGRRVDRGEALAARARDAGSDALFVPGDVSRVADCRSLIEATLDRHGRIDALVNNAGVVGDPPLVPSHAVEEEWWDRVVDVNLKGAFFCCRYALAAMVERGEGAVVNVSSRRAQVPGPQMAAYAASKAGLVHMGASLAEEYRGTGIRVNTVVLGGVVGETADAVSAAVGARGDAERAKLTAAASGGVRGGLTDPTLIAQAIAALLSPACRVMTGAVVALG
jgi:3-oxoacyl-[acyl-carrier protein] reductase